MAVLSYRELVGRTFSHKFGEAPTSQIQYAVTLDNPETTHQEILDAVGIYHGAQHPEYSYLRCMEGSVSENSPDPWHATVSYNYALPELGGNSDYEPHPLGRKDVWSFSTGGAQVPALVHYDGTGNSNIQPLVNAAGDFFEGLMLDESEVRASISGNRARFPLAMAAAVTNSVNASPYLGGDAYTWKCAGISAQQASEVVNSVEINYWQVSVELVYRQSGWRMLLPHVGWHYIAGSTKKVCYALDDEGNKIAASSPQPLNSDGTLKYPGAPGTPDILTRRLNPAVDFEPYFGVPIF